MKILISIAIALVSSIAPGASLQGLWTGWGEWTYDGSGTDCPIMQIQFSETKKILKRDKGYFDCQVVGLETYPAMWTKRGHFLMFDNKTQGTYDGARLKIRESYGNEGVYIETIIQAEGLHMDYNETWYEANGNTLYEITGRLFKKEK